MQKAVSADPNSDTSQKAENELKNNFVTLHRRAFYNGFTRSNQKPYKNLHARQNQVPALRTITLAIEEGEFTSISGPSGSGKTTLLNLLGLIDSPTSGQVYLEGTEVKYNGLTNLHRVRLEKLGFIFQTFNLIPVLSAYENVEYPFLLTKKIGASGRNSSSAH